MVKILVADNDMDSHELVHDILEINFKDVRIDRALNLESLLTKIKEANPRYHLILLNLEMQKECDLDILTQIKTINPDILDRIVVMTNEDTDEVYPKPKYHIPKPFSLDQFGEVVKKACSRK